MKLSQIGREFYVQQIDTDPAVDSWDASFDGGGTWVAGEAVPATSNTWRWLVNGPGFDPDNPEYPAATSSTIPFDGYTPLLRAVDNPEIPVRRGTMIRFIGPKVPSIITLPPNPSAASLIADLDTRVDLLETSTGEVTQAELDAEATARAAADIALDGRLDTAEADLAGRLSGATLTATFAPGGTAGNAGLSTLGGRNPAGLGNAFAGVLATLRRGYRSTCIGLIGDSTGDNKQVGTGTSVDEWSRVFLKRLGQDFPGYTVHERQWNDTNQNYDAPIVHQTGTIASGAIRYATLATGQLAYTAASVTGDLDVRAHARMANWSSGTTQTILAKYDPTGNQRGFLFQITSTGKLQLIWSTDGNSGATTTTVTGGTTVPFANATSGYVRAVLTTGNPYTVIFYTSTDGVTWTQLGTTTTGGAATSIFNNSTTRYTIGSYSSSFTAPFAGDIHSVAVNAGSTAAAQPMVPPLPDDWEVTSGETTVTFGGAPILTLLNGSTTGQNVAYFDNSTRRPLVHRPYGQGVVIINTGHNESLQARQTWLSNYGTMVTNIKSLVPLVPILAFAQNPVGLGGSFSITQQGLELRAARGALLMQWAASQAGVWSFDAWPFLTAADTSDQLHPSVGTGSGSEKWGLALYNRLMVAGSATY